MKCGTCPREADEGFKRCGRCRELARESTKRHRERHPESIARTYRQTRERYRSDPAFRQRRLDAQRRWNEKNRGKTKNSHFRYRLVDVEDFDFDKMYDEQGGCCAICGDGMERTGRGGAQLDHDHGTGKIRALLCPGCNGGIGLLRDDIGRLEAAIAYLKQHAGVVVS